MTEIDRHPLTLRSMFRLGIVQNRERDHAAAERTLGHLFTLQQELGDSEISKTRAEIAASLAGQGKLPVIARHPESAKVDEKDRVTLRVEVSGEGPWSYQWFRNGDFIDGAIQQELAISILSPADFGSYHVQVTPAGRDDVGPVVSNFAHVAERLVRDRPPPRNREPIGTH